MSEFRVNLLEKLTKHTLLPEDLERKREEIKVIKLPVKGYPEGYFTNVDNSDAFSSIFSIEKFDKKIVIGNAGHKNGILITRKAFPHSLYGMMLVKNHNTREVGINDFPEQERYDFFKIAEEFARFSESKGLYPNICWTYDPDTVDRKSGQSQLWYHMHLNSHTPESKKQILSGSRELRSVSSKETKRSFIEEFSIVASLILKDFFEKSGVRLQGKTIAPFEFENLPNFGIISDKGWGYVLSKEFNDDLLAIHKAILMIYKEIKTLLFIGDSEEWKRPKKNGKEIKPEQFPWMSLDTIETLKVFVENLDSTLLEKMKELFKDNSKSGLTSHLFPLAGPSYAMTITKVRGDQILVSVRPQMFSDTGAAGLHHIFGTTVKLARGSECYSKEELKSKIDFEEGFVDFIKNTKLY